MIYRSFMFARSNTGTVPVAVSELAGRGMIDRVSRVCQVLRKHRDVQAGEDQACSAHTLMAMVDGLASRSCITLQSGLSHL